MYSKTNWIDRIVQFPKRFLKSNETASSVTLTADPGTVTAAGTPLSATNLNKIEDGLDKAHNQYADDTFSPKPGLNVITAGQNGRMKLQKVAGRTLVNLLGRDGNCESLAPFISGGNGGTSSISTTQKRSGNNSIKFDSNSKSAIRYKDYTYQLEATKQYVVACWVFIESHTTGIIRIYLMDVGVGGTVRYSADANTSLIGRWQLVFIKIPTANTLVGNGFRLSFGNWSDATVAVTYFDDIRLYEVTAAESTAIGTTITGDAIDAYLQYVDDVKPVGAPYFYKYGKNLLPPFSEWTLHANAVVTEPYKLTLNATGNGQNSEVFINVVKGTPYTISAQGNGHMAVYRATNGVVGTVLVPFQNVGTFTFTPDTDQVRVSVSSNILGVGTYVFSNIQLELGSVATPFQPRNDDYSFFPNTFLHASPDGSVADILYEDGDGQARKLAAFKEMLLDGSLVWSFGSDYTGYKRVKVTASGSITSSVNVFSVKYDGKVLTNIPSGAFTSSDQVSIGAGSECHVTIPDTDSGWGESYTPSAAEIKAYFNGWKMFTDGAPSADTSLYNGTGVKAWVRQTVRTKTGLVIGVDYVTVNVPTALADSVYTPYKLVYQLAKPVPESVEREGTITLHEGGNQIEVGNGVVVRERSIPQQHATSKRWYINESGASSSVANNPLRYRLSKFLFIYKERIIDPKWLVQTDSSNQNGTLYVSVDDSEFSKISVYSVTYLALDTYLIGTTPQSITIAAPYNLRPSLDSVAAASAEQDKRIDALENAKYSPPPNTMENVNPASKDATIGVYRDVDFTRLNGTLAMTSRLSNPDGNGFYRTMTWVYYDDTGKVVIRTVVWTIVYDSDGLIMSRTPSVV